MPRACRLRRWPAVGARFQLCSSQLGHAVPKEAHEHGLVRPIQNQHLIRTAWKVCRTSVEGMGADGRQARRTDLILVLHLQEGITHCELDGACPGRRRKPRNSAPESETFKPLDSLRLSKK